MRTLIIRLLFKLLELPDYKDINDKKIENFLFRMFTDLDFREYFRKRDLQLLKTIGHGLSRESYLLLVGQRTELMHMLSEINKTYKTVNARNDRKRKLEEQQRSKVNQPNTKGGV